MPLVVPVGIPVDPDMPEPDVPERRDLRLCLVVVVPVVDDIESLPVDGVDMVPDGDDIVSPGIAPVPVPVPVAVPDDPAVPDPIVPVVEPVEPPLEPAIWALAVVASMAVAIMINVFMMMFL